MILELLMPTVCARKLIRIANVGKPTKLITINKERTHFYFMRCVPTLQTRTFSHHCPYKNNDTRCVQRVSSIDRLLMAHQQVTIV